MQTGKVIRAHFVSNVWFDAKHAQSFAIAEGLSIDVDEDGKTLTLSRSRAGITQTTVVPMTNVACLVTEPQKHEPSAAALMVKGGVALAVAPDPTQAPAPAPAVPQSLIETKPYATIPAKAPKKK